MKISDIIRTAPRALHKKLHSYARIKKRTKPEPVTIGTHIDSDPENTPAEDLA